MWRDIDIVRLQKRPIDGAAPTEAVVEQEKLAADKVANIRSVGIRQIDMPPPKAWGE